MALKYDKIGYWSEIKLEIVQEYAQAYSTAFSKKYSFLHHVYIDAFAGSGTHISKTTKGSVRGSPQIALDIQPHFKEFYFIDTDGEKINELKKITASRPEAHVLQGDCNERLLKDVFPQIQFKDYKRAFYLLDPYGLDLKWDVIETAGKMGTIEIFLNFPVMDMNRNVLLTNPENVNPADALRMDAFWGDHSWRTIAYYKTNDLFGEQINIKQNIKLVTAAFKKRLIKVANFNYVPQPIPMRNAKSAILYYLFFASNNETGSKILTNILNKYRSRGII